jgi:hypothetical protein
MADIGKECRLGAIDLGQRFRSPALLLICLGVADRRGYLTGHQPKKIAIVVIEQPVRVETNHQHAGATCFAALLHRQQRCLVWWHRPWAGREGCSSRHCKPRKKPDFLSAQNLADRPQAAVVNTDRFRGRGMARGDARSASELQGAV